jgi:hypothetical protein
MAQTEETSSADAASGTARRAEILVSVAVSAGVVLSIVGVIDGLVMALHRVVTTCADGTMFAAGQDPVCYRHPNAGVGIAIMVVSAMLGILIVLSHRRPNLSV